jgi:hypothetical protein
MASRLVILIFSALSLSVNFCLWAQDPTPPGQVTTTGIAVTHNQFYCPQAPIPVVATAEITDDDPNNNTLEEVFIQISEGYEAGQDLLTLGGVHPNISSSWSPGQGLLTLSGTATFAEYESAIENVFFETSQTVYQSDRSISISLGSASFLPSNGHYYIYVSDPGIRWDDARDAAAQQTYFGLQGYLVTITSPEEAQLVGEQSPGTGWIGGSDASQEGVWRWVTGPELGTVFWEGAVDGSAPNGAYTFWNCGEPNNFQGNEDYAHITDNSVAGCNNNSDPAFFGSWNDLPIDSGETDPNNPYYPQGFIVEFGGFEGEPELNLTASSVIHMPQVLAETQEFCGPGTYQLSLQGKADQYFWYESPTGGSPVFTGETYTTNLSSSEIYWISPRFAGCPVGERVPFSVIINEVPQANDLSVTQCDTEGDTDGIAEFNLSLYDEDVAGGDLINREVWHYQDAGLNTRIDSGSYFNLFNGQIIYAKVFDTDTDCFSVGQIQLNVTVTESGEAYLESCDDLPGDGFTVFDLSEADEQLITDPNSGITTAYYESYEDALSQSNALPVLYTNTIPNYQVIYVRLQEGNNCFGISEVELQVKALPQIRPDETVYYCLNSFPVPIRIDGGIVNDVPNNYYYNWSTGATTSSIEVDEPGIYTVEVTEVMGCTNQRTITVLPSDLATIQDIEVELEGESSTLSVLVSGSGEYEYAWTIRSVLIRNRMCLKM